MRNTLQKSFQIVIKHKVMFIWLMIVEAFFFYSHGFISGSIHRKFADYLTIIGVYLSEAAAGLTREETVFNLLDKVPEAQALIPSTIVLFILYLLSIYLLYCIIHGYIWYKVKHLVGEKIRFKEYSLSFFKVTILWFGLFIITLFLNSILIYQQSLVQRYNVEANPLFRYLLFLIWFVIIYFGLYSYTRGKLKNIFTDGVKNWQKLLPSYIIIGALLFISSKIFAMGNVVAWVIGLVLFLATLVWGKMYLNLVT